MRRFCFSASAPHRLRFFKPPELLGQQQVCDGVFYLIFVLVLAVENSIFAVLMGPFESMCRDDALVETRSAWQDLQ